MSNEPREGETAAPLVNITGDRVALGPLRRDLLPTYLGWINDFGTMRTLMAPPRPVTTEAETEWFERAATTDRAITFTIYERATWRPIGTTDLHDIDYMNRRATFGILIGEAEWRGRGYGTETTRLMLDYAFTGLNLHNVMLIVYEYNLAGRRTYEKAGYREIGRRRQCRFMGGRFWDEIYMDCLASEFSSPVLKDILAPDTPRGPA